VRRAVEVEGMRRVEAVDDIVCVLEVVEAVLGAVSVAGLVLESGGGGAGGVAGADRAAGVAAGAARAGAVWSCSCCPIHIEDIDVFFCNIDSSIY